MAKLKSERFSVSNQAGDKLEFVSDVTVDGNGSFNMTIPELMLEIEPDFVSISHEFSCAQEWIGKRIKITRPRNNYRISSLRLSDCREFIEMVLKKLLDVEIEEEVVILYGVKADYSAWELESGELVPNGYFGSSETGKWRGNLGGTNHSQQYSIGVGAEVKKKITYHRGASVRVKYERPDYPNFQHNSWGEKLNAIVGIHINDDERGRFKEMPYSDDAAKFFYDTIMGLAEMGRKLESFFGDDGAVAAMIENKSQLLLGTNGIHSAASQH